jgi:NTE family protein
MPDDPNTSHAEFNAGPARSIPGDAGKPVKDALGLCLSGGGYRAMLFHLGTLWRLNEFALLPKIARISSVSGGSITSGALAMKWSRLNFADDHASNFEAEVAKPLYHLAKHTIDLPAIGGGVFLPFVSVADILIREYKHFLFGDTTLQDLPDNPEFVFNATNLQSLALWRFSKSGMRDWRVGVVPNPRVDLAVAVAASSAFPPVLSPLVLRFRDGEVQPMDGCDLHAPPYTTKVVLSDGGVYDNMGIETVWKSHRRILVSDAGGKMSPVPNPAGDWAREGIQVLSMGDNQVRNLRKRQVVDSLVAKERLGAYWSIRSQPADYPYHSSIPISSKKIDELALEPTRLAGIENTRIEELINWGYAMCDIACQSWYSDGLATPPAAKLPYPNSRLGDSGNIGNVDPITLATTLISGIKGVIDAVSVYQKERDYALARRAFEARQTAPSRPPEQDFIGLVARVVPKHILAQHDVRIRNCWTTHSSALDPDNENDAVYAVKNLKACVCRELQAIKTYTGALPSDLQERWEAFGCTAP